MTQEEHTGKRIDSHERNSLPRHDLVLSVVELR